MEHGTRRRAHRLSDAFVFERNTVATTDGSGAHMNAKTASCRCGCRERIETFVEEEVGRFVAGEDPEPFVFIAAYLRGLQAAVDILDGRVPRWAPPQA